MSDKKYLVPSEMSRAAWVAMDAHVKTHGPAVGCQPGSMCSLTVGLEAAIRWLDAQIAESSVEFHRAILEAEGKRFPGSDEDWKIITRRVDFEYGTSFARNYIRRMFEAPEPGVPDAVKDLLNSPCIHGFVENIHCRGCEQLNERILEAYKRGKAGK